MAIAGMAGLLAVSGCGKSTNSNYYRQGVEAAKNSVGYSEIDILTMIKEGSTEISDDDKKRFVNILSDEYYDALSKNAKEVCDNLKSNIKNVDVNSNEFKSTIEELYIQLISEEEKDVLGFDK